MHAALNARQQPDLILRSGGMATGEGWVPSNDESCNPGWMLPLTLFSLAYSSFIITGARLACISCSTRCTAVNLPPCNSIAFACPLESSCKAPPARWQAGSKKRGSPLHSFLQVAAAPGHDLFLPACLPAWLPACLPWRSW